ncbi:MAG: thymidine phosphorylase [Myxococcota bacterium]|nr:thymidine phosphorylase [Myxococcota bacterium]
MRSVPELIVAKRDGERLTDAEIRALVRGFTEGTVPDYQMAAFAMAVYFRGMSPRETAALTLAMRDSGVVVDRSAIAGVKVDKHSTGGVGDKVSLCLAPIVAACGLRVPMISGRGLGHTGGTLDKLEAIPGFEVRMPVERFVEQVRRIGCALVGQSADMAPADRRLYALRDVTGTVESIPLITASILSKKLAEGIDALVLDVKVGRGAFMKTRARARALARSIVTVGRLAGLRVSAVLSPMDEPLGYTVGNALETAEAFEVLRGGGPRDLVALTLLLGARMLRLGGIARGESQARARMREVIASGAAVRKMEEIIEAQGGDPRVVREPDRLPRARFVVPVEAHRSGRVVRADAFEIGLAAMALGAGRRKTDDVIDPAVGIVLARKVRDRVRRGEPLAWLHANDHARAEALVERVRGAFRIAPGG